MKGKRVLTLLLAAAVTVSNGSIVFAAESSSTEYTETTGMEAAVREEVQQSEEQTQDQKTETRTDTEKQEEPEEVLESTEENPEDNENKEAVTENLTETEEQLQAAVVPEEIEDVPAQGAATSGNYGVNMGDNITWNFDESTGTLTLSGSGEMYDLPDSEYAPWYSRRKDITEIVVDNGITSIGREAFYNMVQAASISIPESVTVIKGCALQGCKSIKKLHLPDNLVAIGTNAFQFMDSCEGFYIDKQDATFYTKDGVLFYDTTLICYPQNKKDESYIIPYKTQIIECDAFCNTPNLKYVYIPETVRKIAYSAFNNEKRSVMSAPVEIYMSHNELSNMNISGAFRKIPDDSKVYAKSNVFPLVESQNAITCSQAEAKLYEQKTFDNYNAMKNWYAGASTSKRVESNQITPFGMHQDAATDCVTWSSSDPSVAAVVVPVVKFEDLKNRIYYNEAETSCSGGYVKGGTKPGTATITVTREDKKDSFSFTVENVVPTTSTEIYHQADGKQQVLGNSLCIHTGKSDTVSLQTVPGLTTALTNGVTWSVSDPSKVSVTAEGTYHEKATLHREKAGDVTVTATMEDENKKEIKKTFQVIGDKSSEDWYVLVNDGERVWVTDSTPVEPIVVVRDSNGTVFKEGTDYTVQYQDNYLPDGKQACGVYVYVTPIGSYVGNPVLTGLLSLCRGEQPDDTDDDQNTDDDPKSNDTKDTSNSKKPQNPTTANKLKKQKITKVSSTYKKSVGQSFTLKPKAKGKITYKTGNKKVATVNSKGKVTVKGTGKATITVTAKATSTYSKCVKKITIYGVPKKPEMKKLTAGKKKFTVQWKKDKKADGYQIQYSTDKKFKKNVKSVNVSKKSTKATVKKLKKGKTYRVRTRSYKKIDGKKYYSGWGKVKSVKVK